MLQSVRLHMFDTSKEKTQVKKMKKRLLSSLNEKKKFMELIRLTLMMKLKKSMQLISEEDK